MGATDTKPAAGKDAPPLRPLPFRAGVQPTEVQTYDESRQLVANSVTLPTYTIEPTGFLKNIFLLVQTNATPNTNANVTYSANGPFNVIDQIQFKDAISGDIIGGAQFNGWDLGISNKYGGYSHNDDPKSGPVYFATTGTSTAGGAFQFVLRIPIEFCKRDGVGSLVNKSSSTTYKIFIRLSDSATPYGTAPNAAAPTVRVRIIPESYWDPDENDRLLGRALTQMPPLNGTTQIWTKSEYTLAAGAVAPMLTGLGNLIRNLIFIMQDGSASRTQGDADFPDPFQLKFEANDLMDRLKTIWQYRIASDYGYSGTVETAGGRDYGVYPKSFCDDFGHKPGVETRRSLLRTSPDSRLQVKGNITGTGTHKLFVLMNHIAPAGDPAALIV